MRSRANNVFEDYPLLLMEIILCLPYQMKKISEGNPSAVQMPAFDNAWYKLLTEEPCAGPKRNIDSYVT